MKTNYKLIAIALCCSLCSMAQEMVAPDTLIDKQVTVEREFTPAIQQAGKIAVQPQVYESQIPQTPVTYSTYFSPLATTQNINRLPVAGTSFNNTLAHKNGFLQAGVGHPLSLLNFRYRLTDTGVKRNAVNLDVYAHHNGQWGRKFLEQTDLGLNINKSFGKFTLFFDAMGGSEAWNNYGKPGLWDVAKEDWLSGVAYKDIVGKDHRNNLWKVDAHIGASSLPTSPIEYSIQTGYEGSFLKTGKEVYAEPLDHITFAEHIIHTQACFEVPFTAAKHRIGADFEMYNTFVPMSQIAGANAKAQDSHFIHLTPYYNYTGKRLRLHAGVNLNVMNGYERVFAIAPDVHVEADLTRDWLSAYADVTGGYEPHLLREETEHCRYTRIATLLTDSACGLYKPVEAVLGLKIRPIGSLLIDIHAGYDYTLDDHFYAYDAFLPYLQHYDYSTQTWRFGGAIHYHYKDYVTVNLSGDYFLDKHRLTESDAWQEGRFDAPKWQVRLRIDGRINEQWSLYSDNYLIGSREAFVQTPGASSIATLRPYYDLNLGVEYKITRWLAVYAQLNNYLAFTNRLTGYAWYGYQNLGANCMMGATWMF